MNIKRCYFIRPYVSKKFQQLCSSTCSIEEQLFPKDVAKSMKEISGAQHMEVQKTSDAGCMGEAKATTMSKIPSTAGEEGTKEVQGDRSGARIVIKKTVDCKFCYM
jgi:hypothetical protein